MFNKPFGIFVFLVPLFLFRVNGLEGQDLLLEINNKVKRKQPNIDPNLDWQLNVYVKFYENDKSIKIHCPRGTLDTPFGRTLGRAILRNFKTFLPENSRVTKTKLSLNMPQAPFTNAMDILKDGYEMSLKKLLGYDIKDISSKSTTGMAESIYSPKFDNAILSSPTTLPETPLFIHPVYVFYETDNERKDQESMVQFMIQLGLKVFHTFGTPRQLETSIISTSAKYPDIISPAKYSDIISTSTKYPDVISTSVRPLEFGSTNLLSNSTINEIKRLPEKIVELSSSPIIASLESTDQKSSLELKIPNTHMVTQGFNPSPVNHNILNSSPQNTFIQSFVPIASPDISSPHIIGYHSSEHT
ncbi:hypothetical protein cand_036080 [Cryptosporidium andersoni]|uniref:Uncharacterized protein n=1 Tax=Cryptosporidium andersoni TaxID=117008 RepID=A0A1J4MYZ9_9CRYT|nr:hypothetical protein cand_036080 [Cryptosporidium andersoni]